SASESDRRCREEGGRDDQAPRLGAKHALIVSRRHRSAKGEGLLGESSSPPSGPPRAPCDQREARVTRRSMMVGEVIECWRYPVKSMLGEPASELRVDARGVAGDRAYAVRDPGGKLGSGKNT